MVKEERKPKPKQGKNMCSIVVILEFSAEDLFVNEDLRFKY